MGIAIVTGASSGIGEGFCRRLDGLGLDSIWITSRSAHRLEKLASQLKTPVRVVPCDLASQDGLNSFVSEICNESPSVDYLINCAGVGFFGDSWGIPSKNTESMISLNISALVAITDCCIPFMSEGSAVIQMCSASAYLPLPYLNVYAATKSFVKSYCDGLRHELKGMGIRVLEVSPGWVSTAFISKSVEDADVPQRVFKHTVTVEQVVDEAFVDLEKGRDRSVCGCYNKFQVYMCRHLPSVAGAIWRHSLRL